MTLREAEHMSDDSRSLGEECSICSELTGGPAPYSRRYGHRARDYWRGSQFVVLPTLAPLSVGHILVLPIKHLTSFAELAAAGQLARSVLTEVLAKVEHRFGPCVCFEHGTLRPSADGGCSVSHAHVHVVPVSSTPVFPDFAAFKRAETWKKVVILAAGRQGYIYLRWVDGETFCAPVDDLPSQTMRRWLAQELGVQRWDWRSSGADELLHPTIGWLSTTDPPPSLIQKRL